MNSVSTATNTTRSAGSTDGGADIREKRNKRKAAVQPLWAVEDGSHLPHPWFKEKKRDRGDNRTSGVSICEDHNERGSHKLKEKQHICRYLHLLSISQDPCLSFDR